MNQTKFLESLEKRPLRMAVERKLPRPQLVIRPAAAPAPASDSPLPKIVIIGLGCSLVYAFMRTILV